MSQKLTKVAIRKWLENKRSAQLSELRESQAKEEKAFRDTFMVEEGFKALYDKYDPILKEFKVQWDAIYDRLIDNGKLTPTYYSLTGDRLDSLVCSSNSLGTKDAHHFNIATEEYKKLEEQQDIAIEEIREEWDKLIGNVKALNSVKKILAYLNDLEIDTSEITPVEKPQLPATPIKIGLLKI